MSHTRRTPAKAALLFGVVAALLAMLVATVAALRDTRSAVTASATALQADVAALAALPAGSRAQDLTPWLASAAAPARVVDASGKELARTGDGLWDRGAAGPWATVALLGSGAAALDDAVAASRAFPGGRTATLRRALPDGTTAPTLAVLLAIVFQGLVAGAVVGAATFVLRRRRARDVGALTAMAEAVAAGRPLPEGRPAADDLRRAGDALGQAATRMEHLTEIADRELGLLTAAVEPLPLAVQGRGPAGGRIRNVALERLIDGLGPADRSALEAALQTGLDATDPVGARVPLADGRVMDVDAWSVPGGRLVSVSERTEQERLAAFRRQIESTAVRQLSAPIEEIKTRGKSLYTQVPATAAKSLHALLGATDRLDRVVRMMLRGTANDPAGRAPRREVFGVAGFLWGQAHDWDAALRSRALRVELDIAADLPDVRTDPALVQEILTELIDNAAKFTPRGGTIRMTARGEAQELVIDVRDNGPGIAPADAPHAAERFYRGRSSEPIPGAGLGLGVAAALAERIGGRLEVLPDDGGHVRLLLPAAEAALKAA